MFNAGTATVDLSGWGFTAGVDFTFPEGVRVAAGGYLVVAHDLAQFKERHPNLSPLLLYGDYTGKLSGKSDHLVLGRPVVVTTSAGKSTTKLATVCEASYTASGRWSKWSEQGGSSLERVDSRTDGHLASNWQDSDESGRVGWTTVEFTGVMDNGATGGGGFPGGGGPGGGGPGGGFPGGGGPGGGGTLGPDSLHIILLGEGECLIDNVEVIGPGATNRIANGNFETGTSGWTFSGNHIRSSLETGDGYESSQSLHLRASGNGDTGANKIYAKLTTALTNGNTATLRARVKWIAGWPEILLRLRGNSLEAFGRLQVPAVSGTPGARNSRASVNAPPAFGEVRHFPVTPAADEPVTVTARVDDPDGIKEVRLLYRTDPAAAQTAVSMNDDGQDGDAVPGDGIFSGIVPAPGSAKLVAFAIEASDRAAAPLTSVFPPGAPVQECLVRFGDGIPSGAFGTYRLWVTQANADLWKNRPMLSNEPVESTFVYGNFRAIYNAGGRFAGSPYHQQFTTGPASQAHFTVDLPRDDRFLGQAGLNKLHAPGNGAFDDTTLQREQVAYWLARQSGLPWLSRRYVHFYVNGARKQNLMEDTQVGNDDLVKEFWPNDTQGDLFKMQPWFEFADAVTQSLSMQSSTFVSIARFTTSSNQLKLARYRWNWLVRGADLTANHYSNVLDFVNLATDSTNPSYEANLEAVVDVDEWMRFFALNHALGNWDSVGYRNAQNTYSYKPTHGRWQLIPWDANIVLGGGGSDSPSNLPLFTTGDPTLSRWFSQGGFKRRFLSAFYRLVNGPMQTPLISPVLDAKYAAFQEHGITAASPEPIKTWVNSARNFILGQINSNSAAFAVTNAESGGALALSGTGPLDMVAVQVNGTSIPVTWISVKTWTATLAVPQGLNTLTVAALNGAGEVIAGAEQQVVIQPPGRLSVSRTTTGLTLNYQTSRNGVFTLQASPTLDGGGTWTTVASQPPVNGFVEFQLSLPLDSIFFYRLMEP